MQQTPMHDGHNELLLQMIPADLPSVIEIGCSAGALARAYKGQYPACRYVGVDIDPEYAAHAAQYCDEAFAADIDAAPASFFDAHRDAACWIFGDVLEHLRDPWRVLSEVKRVLPPGGHVVACVPNAQHWTVQARLATGLFRYEPSGLLDRTHLRWFTRQTLYELFDSSGWRVLELQARFVQEPDGEALINVIGDVAETAGMNREIAMEDCRPFQYLVRAAAA